MTSDFRTLLEAIPSADHVELRDAVKFYAKLEQLAAAMLAELDRRDREADEAEAAFTVYRAKDADPSEWAAARDVLMDAGVLA